MNERSGLRRELTPLATTWRASISRPESVSSRIASFGFNSIICGLVNSVIAGQVSGLLGGLEPALETGLNAGLDRLDCGTCDTDCPADLTCVVP